MPRSTNPEHPWVGRGSVRPPCGKCTCREQGCHGHCRQYAEYRAVMDAQAKQRESTADVNAVTIRSIERVKKRNGRKRK